ncbi:MFS transporter [Oceanobacter mangrovi]|uniref:MFS transporter n=1 Tax=Oceanobacter mangrovi TaxID=2862510 RepID=UPI001C8E801A|nr:MFS transporter [Oceanobacter mangrovi]
MIPVVMPIFSLLVGVALLLFGSGLLNTLLSLRGGLEGYSDSLIGYIMSGYFFGYFVGSFMGLKLLRRVGHVRAFSLCAAVSAATVLLHVLIVNPYIWIVLRVITGATLVILYTIIESWLNDQTPAEKRGQVFAVYIAVTLAALALTQQLLVLDSPLNFTLFAIAAMLVCVSLIPVSWTRLPQPKVTNVSRYSLRKLMRQAPLAVMGSALSGLVMGAFWGLMPIYGQRIGLDAGQVANLMSAAIIGGFLFQYPIGRFSDGYDRRIVLGAISALGFVVTLISWLLPIPYWMLLLNIALWGGAAFSLYPVAVAHLVDHIDSNDILPAGSANLLVYGIGAAIGPAVSGEVMQATGPGALLALFALSHGVYVAYVVYRLKRPAASVEEQPESPAAFVPMLRTSPAVLEMHPDEPLAEETPLDVAANQPFDEPPAPPKAASGN